MRTKKPRQCIQGAKGPFDFQFLTWDLLGCSAAQSAAAVTALLRESGVGAIDALLPLALLLPAFFLLAASAMRLSGEAWSALSRLGRFGRGELLMRHALLWCAGLGAVLLRLLA